MPHETYDEPPYTPDVLGNARYSPEPETVVLIERAKHILAEYEALSLTPLTVRQVYYRLVATHAEYPKNQKFYKSVGKALARARRAGLVAWELIRDDGDTVDAPHGYDSAAGLKKVLMWTAEDYRRNRQEGQPRRIIVACEAAGMVPMLSRVCHPYGVTVRSSGGTDSVTAKRALGVEIATMRRPTLLLHVGDWDPQGLTIYTHLYHDVKRFAADYMRDEWQGTMPDDWYTAKRISITPDQVDRYIDASLLGRVKTSEDERKWYPGLNGDTTLMCECEALDPAQLVDIVEGHVKANIDKATRQHVLDLEAEECERLQRQIGKLRIGRHGREPGLTPEMLREARIRKNGGMSIRQIASALGVSKSAVARAVAKL